MTCHWWDTQYDSFVLVTWLIRLCDINVRMCDMTHANYSPQISCLCTRVIWLIHICDKPMTYDSFTWLLHMTPSHDSFIRWDAITHTFWFSAGFVRNAASLLNHLHMCVCCFVLFTWHDPFIRATRPVLTCVLWLIHMCHIILELSAGQHSELADCDFGKQINHVWFASEN